MPEPRFLPVVPPGGEEGGPSPAGPLVFERIAVLGVGFIGGSLALAARRAWPACLVIGVDRHEVLEQAMIRHAVDVASSDPMIISAADLVVLAAPLGEIPRLVADLPSWLPSGAVVTDVGSAKRRVVEAAAALPARLAFVGGHPLAGAGQSGIRQARADLFMGRPWLFTRSGGDAERHEQALAKLCAFVAGLGATAVTVPSADAHDEVVAGLPRGAADVESLGPELDGDEATQRWIAAAAGWRAARPARP